MKEDSREDVNKNKKVFEKIEAWEYEDGDGNTLEKKGSVKMGGRGEQKAEEEEVLQYQERKGKVMKEVQEKDKDYEN